MVDLIKDICLDGCKEKQTVTICISTFFLHFRVLRHLKVNFYPILLYNSCIWPQIFLLKLACNCFWHSAFNNLCLQV